MYVHYRATLHMSLNLYCICSLDTCSLVVAPSPLFSSSFSSYRVRRCFAFTYNIHCRPRVNLRSESSRCLLLSKLCSELLILLDLVHLIILLFFTFGIISTTRQSCRKGKFRSDFGRFAWMAAKSYAMAASFVVPKRPRWRSVPST